MQVVPDRQIGHHVDPVLAQVLRGPDTGEHQQPGATQGPGADDHLAARPDRADRSPVAARHQLHPDGPAPGDHHPGRGRPGDDPQIGRRAVEITAVGTGPPPSADALLDRRHAGLIGTVVVGIPIDAGRRREGVQVSLGDLGQAGRAFHGDRTVPAAQFASTVLEALQPPEGRQHIAVRPARRAIGGPAVEVAPVSPHERHAVDDTAAAEHPAVRLRKRATVHLPLRDGMGRPGDQPLQGRDGVDGAAHAGDRHQWTPAATTGFDQGDRGSGVGEPAGDDGPGAARPDHHVVRRLRLGRKRLRHLGTSITPSYSSFYELFSRR